MTRGAASALAHDVDQLRARVLDLERTVERLTEAVAALARADAERRARAAAGTPLPGWSAGWVGWEKRVGRMVAHVRFEPDEEGWLYYAFPDMDGTDRYASTMHEAMRVAEALVEGQQP